MKTNFYEDNVVYSFNFYSFLKGIAVGHVYYFLEDVFPQQHGGFRILKTPNIL